MSESKLVVHGGKRLAGEVSVSGGKNSVVAILPAALLCEDVCHIENLPAIKDVAVLKAMLEALGANVQWQGSTMRIDARTLNSYSAPDALVRKMRASYYLMGALVSRFGRAEVAMPGGCDIGSRPIDYHIKGFEALGITVENVRGVYVCSADTITGSEIYLDNSSVGATINIMLASVRAQGITTIVNAAKEPHIVDVASFLNSMGARIKGAGTDTIRIMGVDRLHGCTYSIVPDQIETGTWMAIAAATRGDITIRNCIPYHMEAVSAKLMEMGFDVREGMDYLRVIDRQRPRPVRIRTQRYPGVPTDLQQIFTVLLCLAQGTSIVVETIYEARYKYIDELRRMGANIRVQDRMAVVDGVEGLWGNQVNATDLRAGAALVVAGLVADGVTTINRADYIDRGYDAIDVKLRALGADVQRIEQ